jgi:hypothetical protein
VRRDGRGDQRISLEGSDELLRARERLGRRLRVRDRKLDHRLSKHTAQARGLRLLRNLLFEVIHVGIGRGAGLDHLERRQSRAGANELRRDRFRFGREDVLLQPFHEREIVGEPAVQHHRRMRMRIDQAGKHDLTGGVDCVAPAVAARDRRGGIHSDDVAAIDGNGTVRDHPHRRIHGDDSPVRDDERHAARPVLRRQPHGGRTDDARRQQNSDLHRTDCMTRLPVAL